MLWGTLRLMCNCASYDPPDSGSRQRWDVYAHKVHAWLNGRALTGERPHIRVALGRSITLSCDRDRAVLLGTAVPIVIFANHVSAGRLPSVVVDPTSPGRQERTVYAHKVHAPLDHLLPAGEER